MSKKTLGECPLCGELIRDYNIWNYHWYFEHSEQGQVEIKQLKERKK